MPGGADPARADLVVYNSLTNGVALFDSERRAWAGRADNGTHRGRTIVGGQVPLTTTIEDLTAVDGCIGAILQGATLALVNPVSARPVLSIVLHPADLRVPDRVVEFRPLSLFEDSAGLAVYGEWGRASLKTFEGFLFRIGPDGAVTSRVLFPVPVQATSVRPDGRGVILLSNGDVLDSASGRKIRRISQTYSTALVDVAFGPGGEVWTAHTTSPIAAPDPENTNYVQTPTGARVPIPKEAGVNDLTAVDGGAFITLQGLNSVWRIASDGTVLARTAVADEPSAATVAGGVLYVTSARGDMLTALDIRSGAVLWTIAAGPNPVRIATRDPARTGRRFAGCRTPA